MNKKKIATTLIEVGEDIMRFMKTNDVPEDVIMKFSEYISAFISRSSIRLDMQNEMAKVLKEKMEK
jgi:hypothetical protein